MQFLLRNAYPWPLLMVSLAIAVIFCNLVFVVVGLLVQDCELKESDYDYSTVRAGQVSIETGCRARLAKRIE